MAKNTKTAKNTIKKIRKSKYHGVFVVIVLLMIAAFVLYCYFNPEFYNKLFSKTPDPLRQKENIITYYESAYVVNDINELDDLKIHMVDVGQGDGIIIELPDGANVLIDATTGKNEQDLLDYAQKLEIEVFDVVIMTHADEDHIGGMDVIFENFEVKNCYRPYVYYSGDKSLDANFNQGANKGQKNSAAYWKVLNALYNETYTENGQSYYCNWEFFNLQSEFGRDIVCGDVTYNYTFDFLSPTSNVEDICYSDANDYSPYIRFTYGVKGIEEGDSRFDMLFTGDAEDAAMDELLDFYASNDLDVDVLKAGHHGSRTSTTNELLNKITPEYALISCGLGNSYKHPHQSVLNLFVEHDVVFYRTDLHGDILLTVNENGQMLFTTEKSPTQNIFVGGDAA